MKQRLCFVLCVLMVAVSNFSYAQGSWAQKTNFGGTARYCATGFSIGKKGYIGIGIDPLNYALQDFWEWDQSTNSWTQKANFGGGPREFAVGFSIGTKGYIGTGNYSQEFWEWDQTTNVWTQKAIFGGSGRNISVGFSIGTKGYIGTGDKGGFTQDFWEWDQATNAWTQKANFGGTARFEATGFSIGTKGYIGTGYDYNGVTKDFWEWNQTTNLWTQLANFPGQARETAVGFSIGNYGFMGLGFAHDGPPYFNDFYLYDPSTNLWTPQVNFSGPLRNCSVGFSIGCQGYIGTGAQGTQSQQLKDFWEFTPTNSSVTANINSSAMTICNGQNVTLTANGGIGYSWNISSTSSIIIVNPTSNTTYSVSVSNGYCSDDTSLSILVNPLPSPAIFGNTAICIGKSTTLNASGGLNYSWSTNATTTAIFVSPSANTSYTLLATDVNGCSDTATIIVLVNPLPIPIISGNNSICIGDVTTLTATGGTNYLWSTGATTISVPVNPLLGTSYAVTVTDAKSCSNTTSVNVVVNPLPVPSITGANAVCPGVITTLHASGGVSYSWSTGATVSVISVSPGITSSYSVTAIDNNGCKADTNYTITVFQNPSATISGSVTIFPNQSTTLTASGGGSYSWNTGETTIAISVSPTITTIYCVTIANTNNCKDSICATVFIESPCDTAGTFFFPNAFSPNNDQDNDVLKIYYRNMDCIESLHLVIYDRWGEQVYETLDKNFSWDGTYPNKSLNTQVLAYHLTVGFTDGKAINRKGNVSLVR